eukprot:gene15739-15556_t
MLKRIRIQHLTLGMYLHEFCGSWMDHPFWRAKFVLKDPKDLARIQATAIDEVWIDTSKGLDVAAGVTSVSREEADHQIDSEFALLEDMPAIVIAPPPPPPAPVAPRGRLPATMQNELKVAASICSESKRAVVSMFNEARLGKAVDSVSAQNLVEEISDSVTRNPGALISLARLKTADDYTYMHSVAVCAMMVALAKQAFVKSIGIYPVGSLVRLTSGRIGVVMEQGEKSLTSPRVKVFFSTKSDLRIPPEVVDLAEPGCNEKVVAREDPDKWRFPDLNELWSGMPE